MVAVPAAVDGDVFHRQWPRAAVLHRAVLAARLRELHARRRHPADAARDLDRLGLWRFPQGAIVEHAAGRLRQLRIAMESLAMLDGAPARPGGVVVVIPPFNEAESIAAVVAEIPRDVVGRVIVADGGSRDGTPEKAGRAGAEGVAVGRGYGLACLNGAQAALAGDIVVFMDGDGAGEPGA